MDEQHNNLVPQRRRISFGFVFIIALTVGLISFFVYRLISNIDRSDHLDRQTFVSALVNGRVSNATYTRHEGSQQITITGEYTNINGAPKTYTFDVPETIYEDKNLIYTVTIETGKEVKFSLVDASGAIVNYNVGKEDVDRTITINSSVSSILAVRVGTINIRDIYQSNWWDQWGPTVIMLLGSAIIVVFLFSRLSSSVNGANRQAMDFNKSRARRIQDSKVRFKDVAGCDAEKAEMEEIVEYLKDPQKYTKFGAKLPKGILLVGSPGTGKTLLAKAVAGEAGVPFFSISGSDFVEMFVGVGAGRVRDMFKTAKQNAPCLVFIDEIDAVGRQRGAGLGGGNDEREQTLNQLLVEMDGFSDNSGIIVMAATNRDDVLDPALLRAGRFDRKITVSLPDREGREAIFKVHARNKKLEKDVDFAQLAKRTVGFSGADIENIMNEAAILAVRRKKDAISTAEIDEAIDRRIAGPAKTSRSLNKHERDVVAHHEAGHAIIGLKLEHSDKVQKITIIPRGNTGGHVRMTPEEDRFLLTKKELEARIVGYLGGRSAEEVFFDDVSSGAQNDIEMATRIARMMVTELGMSSLGPIQYERDTGSVFLGRDYTSTQKNFSLATAEKIDSEVTKIINDAHDQAVALIKKYKDDVELIAQTLIEHEQITAEEIDYLLEHRHLIKDEKPAEKVEEKPQEPEVVSAPEEPKPSESDVENKGESQGE